MSKIIRLSDGNDICGLEYSNPNLLDNPWFTINQKGQGTYTTNGYTADRWYAMSFAGYSPTTTISNNGISITGSQYGWRLFQIIQDDNLNGKICTYSLNITSSSGSYDLYIGEGNDTWMHLKTTNQTGIVTVTFTMPSNAYKYLMIQNTAAESTITIKAAKLELGSISTLAMDTAPNYATELLKCQRYFYNFTHLYTLCRGFNYSTMCYANISIHLPTELRCIPNVTTTILPLIDFGSMTKTTTSLSFNTDIGLRNILLLAVLDSQFTDNQNHIGFVEDLGIQLSADY